MTHLKSEFLNIIKARGFLHQCTDLEGLDALFATTKPVTAYIGFDCTAPSLHVGSLMQIMILRWLQKCGHRPIVLMGGGTTKIGDPSGKDEARKLLDDAQIDTNMAGIKEVFSKFLSFSNNQSPNPSNAAVMANNDDWLKNLSLVDFLRDYGKYFSINQMLSMDSVKLRLDREQNLSFLEFNYMLLQAYDFMHLALPSNKGGYDCKLQIGGSDQWGNITQGTDLNFYLNRKIHEEIIEAESLEKAREIIIKKLPTGSRLSTVVASSENFKGQGKSFVQYVTIQDVFGLTTPLITTSSGAKMGKTANGAVWLNADMLSPFDYWQFWRNTEDADVGRFLRFFTELPIAEIAKLEALQGAEINEAKKILANEATKLCHGETAAIAAAETARKTFEEGTAGDNLKTMFLDKAQLATGIPAYELFQLVGLKDSKGEARKLIEGGGGRVNDEKIADPKMLVNETHMTSEGYIKLSAGKKQHLLVKLK